MATFPNWIRRLLPTFSTLAALMFAAEAAGAEQLVGPADAQEVAAFFDTFVARQMREGGVKGLVVTLVGQGEVLLSKGYGHADLAGKVPVSPATTVFPVGSLTKIITATAVLQQVDRGRLELDRDVNDYLPHVQIPATYPEPITLFHLLTHTSGFDDQNLALYSHTRTEAPPLAKRVAVRMPARLRPPGRYIGYTNYSSDLAGYLVERVSGVPFDRYLREHLFTPLHMHSSGLGEVATANGFRAEGRVRRRNGPRPAPPTFSDTPSCGLLTTGHDMARFLLAHLHPGRSGACRLLSDSSLRLMHTRQFSSHPLVAGYAFGFWECRQNDQRVLLHGGFFPGFISLLVLLPDRDVGFFVAYNSNDPLLQLNADLVTAFLDHYYPTVPAAVTLPPPGHASFARFAGTYRSLRYSRATPEKLGTILTGQLRVEEATEGVRIGDEEWSATGPLLFQRRGDYAAFEEDARGVITHLHRPDGTYERAPWYETLPWCVGGLVACGAVFGLTFLVGFVGLLRRIAFNRDEPAALLRAVQQGVTGLSALELYFLLRLGMLVGSSDVYDFLYDFPPLHVLLALAAALAALAFGLTALVIGLWWKGVGSFLSRLYYTLVTAINLVFLALLYNLNLLGGSLP